MIFPFMYHNFIMILMYCDCFVQCIFRFVLVTPSVYRLEVEEMVFVSVHGAEPDRETPYTVSLQILDATEAASRSPTEVVVTQGMWSENRGFQHKTRGTKNSWD